MNITLNGDTTVINNTASLEQLLASKEIKPETVALVINGEVIPRSLWKTTQINDGDAIEIFSAVAGG